MVLDLIAFPVGLVADLINFYRQLIEMTLERVRRLELGEGDAQVQNAEWHVRETAVSAGRADSAECAGRKNRWQSTEVRGS